MIEIVFELISPILAQKLMLSRGGSHHFLLFRKPQIIESLPVMKIVLKILPLFQIGCILSPKLTLILPVSLFRELYFLAHIDDSSLF